MTIRSSIIVKTFKKFPLLEKEDTKNSPRILKLEEINKCLCNRRVMR